MLVQKKIQSDQPLSFDHLINELGVNDVVLTITPDEMPGVWAFYRTDHSVTLFLIEQSADEYTLTMDGLASYDDYRFFPYLLDTLSMQLTHQPYKAEGKTAFELYDEEWVVNTMGEEIAYLKCFLSLGKKYYLSLPIQETNIYVDNEALSKMGVCIYSSTPRIYGYIHYMLRKNLLPFAEVIEEDMPIDEEVDVPQHVSIGSVQSWQTDGAITTESYGHADVKLLLKIAEHYQQGTLVEGVVLNDIGTLYEHGIGVEKDAEQAIYWFSEAIKNGDLLYAPTNLGDLYRKGLAPVEKNLKLAVEAYSLSTDPYAWYRLGQSYEEGWLAEPDDVKAMALYRKAANAGHHLAVKRLSEN